VEKGVAFDFLLSWLSYPAMSLAPAMCHLSHCIDTGVCTRIMAPDQGDSLVQSTWQKVKGS